MSSRPEPCAVYKFERATVRMHGTCANIREETEKFLKKVVKKTAKAVPREERRNDAVS